ncbi:MAG: alpha/beta hydrolase [Thermoleophilaceae bacterium]
MAMQFFYQFPQRSLAPGSRFETIPGAAHFPHLEKPDELVAILRRWLAETPVAEIDDADWGRIVVGSPLERAALGPAAFGPR